MHRVNIEDITKVWQIRHSSCYRLILTKLSLITSPLIWCSGCVSLL